MKTLSTIFILFLTILFSSAAFSASKGSSGGGGGGSWYRAEGGISLSGDYGAFDETKSGTTYQNSLYSYSTGFFFRTGLRLNAISIGIAGAIDVAAGSLGRRTAATVGSNPTYDFQILQGLAGGYLGITLWGDANGPELIGEYYIAQKTDNTEKAVSGSPLQPKDTMRGRGWGAGFSFTVDPNTRFGLMYRKIVYDELNLTGTATPVTRTDLQSTQTMIFVSRRL